MKKENSYLFAECKTLKKNHFDQMEYIELLEKESDRINIAIKRVRVTHPDIPIIPSNPMQNLQKLNKKAGNQFNNTTLKSINNILFEKKREKYTLTDIYDLSKDLHLKIDDNLSHVDIPKLDRGVNAVV
mmetsp:Transcript_2302/g.2243  ORF Transcript_2302/g.2243 Transcript_2302/m.2243 type:complete len:129 (+) Transcript_2302:1722-2108(+)